MKAIHSVKNIKRVIAIVMLCSCVSCESFLDIDPPETQLASSQVFESDLTASSLLSAIYASVSASNGGTTSLTFYGGMMADESQLYAASAAASELYTNNIVSTNSVVANFWGSHGYDVIYKTNVLLDGLKGNNVITPSVKLQLEGEAYFLRGLFHLQLVNLFGDVPLVTSTDYRMNTVLARTSASDVYTGIISDLKEAQLRLPEDYAIAAGERVRPNKWAATALLARTYLYHGDWQLAEEQASLVISKSSLFSMPSLANAFLKGSSEAIWQLKPAANLGLNTNEANIFILTGTPRFLALRDQFVNSFEAGDQRKANWIGSVTVGTNKYFYAFKYKINTATPLNEYSIILRLAEQYLIRAEARAKQDKLPLAIADVDVIRLRAGLPLVASINPAIAKDPLLSVIYNERRIELFSELGHRWIDLKRTGLINTTLSTIKTGWVPTDALFPIPQTEILVNQNLVQNPGY